MNENIDLTKILKNAPEGFKLYSTIYGEVKFKRIDDEDYPLGDVIYPIVIHNDEFIQSFTKDGKYYLECGECILFPSKDQRDWSKFTAPWYKKERFDPKILKPFDKVLARDIFDSSSSWICSLFSHCDKSEFFPCRCVGAPFDVCIPYNNETKHLVGTKEEAPEYYRYWED